MTTAVATTKTKALASNLKVNKTQAVMAAEERYKQRIQALIDEGKYEEKADEVSKALTGVLNLLAELVTQDISAHSGLDSKFINVGYGEDIKVRPTDVDEILMEGEFCGIEFCETLYLTWNGGDKSPRWFSPETKICFKDAKRLLREANSALETLRQLKSKLDNDNLIKVRRELKSRLQSSQQLADMQVVRALLAQQESVNDIDKVLDSLGV